MKKVIRMSFVFFSSPSLLHPSCGLFVCQPSSAHPPPKTPAPPPRPACETKKRTKKQKKSRQKLNLIPYQKKPFLEKSKIFNLEIDREVLAFLGVRAVCVRIFRLTKKPYTARKVSFVPTQGGLPVLSFSFASQSWPVKPFSRRSPLKVPARFPEFPPGRTQDDQPWLEGVLAIPGYVMGFPKQPVDIIKNNK